MSQKSNDVSITFDIISSSDFNSHLDNLINNISADDCSCTCSQKYVSSESAENKNVVYELSQSSLDALRPSPQLNVNNNIQHLQNCNEIRKIRSLHYDGEKDENQVVDDLFLDVKRRKREVLSKISTDLVITSNITDRGYVSKVAAHVTEKLEFKNKFENEYPSQSCNIDQGQILYVSSSLPSDSSKLRKSRCQCELHHVVPTGLFQTNKKELAETNKGCVTESVILEAEKSTVLNQEALIQEKRSKSVLSHHSKAREKEINNESLLEAESDYSTLADMSQVAHFENAHQKSVVADLVRSQSFLDEPVSAKDSAGIVCLQTSEEFPVSLQVPTLEAKFSECSQPDMLTLCTNDESIAAQSVVTVRLNASLLSHHVSSPSSTILPQELFSQSGVHSIISTSPLKSDGNLVTSVDSSLLPSEVSSLKEESRLSDLVSSHTSEELRLSCGMSFITTHMELQEPTNEQSIITTANVLSNEQVNKNEKEMEEETSFVGNLPENLCNDEHSKLISDVTNTYSDGQFAETFFLPSHATTVTPSCAESPADISGFFPQEILAGTPSIDGTVKISQELPSASIVGSHTKVCERSKLPVYEISAGDASPGQATSTFCTSDQEECQHQSMRCADDISKSECEYQEMPKSPQLLMSVDGITYPLLNADDFPHAVASGDHIVPQHENIQEDKLKCGIDNLTKQRISDNDHTLCEETKLKILSKTEILQSGDHVENCGTSISWPKVISASTSHYQDSTRVNLIISAKVNDNKETGNVSFVEDIGNSLEHCSNKVTMSHLNNETSTFSCEETSNKEQRVPEAETCGNMCLDEISFYSGFPENKQNDLLCKQQVKQAFHWTSVYETVMSKSLTDQPTGDCAFEGLSSLTPIVQSNRSIRVGLSRKQRVKHLHSKP